MVLELTFGKILLFVVITFGLGFWYSYGVVTTEEKTPKNFFFRPFQAIGLTKLFERFWGLIALPLEKLTGTSLVIKKDKK